MSDLERSMREDIKNPWFKTAWNNVVYAEDIHGKSIWLMALFVICFSMMVSSVTHNFGLTAFILSTAVTVPVYCVICTDKSSERIWLISLVVCIGVSFTRLSQSPVSMQYCRLQTIRLPPQIVNSTTESELALNFCVKHTYVFSTLPNSNTSESVSTVYILPPKMVSQLSTVSLSLSSYLKNPQIINSWKDILQRVFTKLMEAISEPDLTKDVSRTDTNTMDTELNTKSTLPDAVKSVMSSVGAVEEFDVQ